MNLFAKRSAHASVLIEWLCINEWCLVDDRWTRTAAFDCGSMNSVLNVKSEWNRNDGLMSGSLLIAVIVLLVYKRDRASERRRWEGNTMAFSSGYEHGSQLLGWIKKSTMSSAQREANPIKHDSQRSRRVYHQDRSGERRWTGMRTRWTAAYQKQEQYGTQ